MDYKFTSLTNYIDGFFKKSCEMYLLLQNDKFSAMKFISKSYSYLRNMQGYVHYILIRGM